MKLETEDLNIEADVLSLLLKEGEKQFKDMEEELYIKYRRKYLDENTFRVTLVRELERLTKKDFLEKKILSHKNVHYHIPADKRKKVQAFIGRQALLKSFEEKPADQQLELLKKIERLELELNYYKNLNETKTLSDEDFPFKFLMKKLSFAGFELEDFYDERHLQSEEDVQAIKEYRLNPDHLINVLCTPRCDVYKDKGLDDIEIKVFAVDEARKEKLILTDYEKFIYSGKIVNFHPLLHDFWGDWKLVTPKYIRGKVVYARFGKLVKLAKENFNYEVLRWKLDLDIPDEDWKELEPPIRREMELQDGSPNLDSFIFSVIGQYLFSKKPGEEAQKEFATYYIRFKGIRGFFIEQEEAQKIAKQKYREFLEWQEKKKLKQA